MVEYFPHTGLYDVTFTDDGVVEQDVPPERLRPLAGETAEDANAAAAIADAAANAVTAVVAEPPAGAEGDGVPESPMAQAVVAGPQQRPPGQPPLPPPPGAAPGVTAAGTGGSAGVDPRDQRIPVRTLAATLNDVDAYSVQGMELAPVPLEGTDPFTGAHIVGVDDVPPVGIL